MTSGNTSGKRTGAALRRGNSRQDYRTPKPLLDAVRAYLGITDFSIDLAATRKNAVTARYIGLRENALGYVSWRDKIGDGWGWLNPPLDTIQPWAVRCWNTWNAGGHVAFLVPASVGANWFRDYVHNKARVLFLNGRVPFMPDKPNWLYPKDCLVALYGVPPGYECWTWSEEVRKLGLRSSSGAIMPETAQPVGLDA